MDTINESYNIYLKALSDYHKIESDYISTLAKYNLGEISIDAWSKATTIWQEAEKSHHQAIINWRRAKLENAKKSSPKNTPLPPEITGTKPVKILPEDSITERKWNFRDDNNQHFYGDIPERQQVITITLNWKPNKQSETTLVGKYKIDLRSLLSEGYAQKSNRGIRLRFQRTGDNIEIAIDHGSPALVVGRKPEN